MHSERLNVTLQVQTQREDCRVPEEGDQRVEVHHVTIVQIEVLRVGIAYITMVGNGHEQMIVNTQSGLMMFWTIFEGGCTHLIAECAPSEDG